MKTLEAERELFGLDQPKRIDAKVEVGFDWNALASAAISDEPSVDDQVLLLVSEPTPVPVESPIETYVQEDGRVMEVVEFDEEIK